MTRIQANFLETISSFAKQVKANDSLTGTKAPNKGLEDKAQELARLLAKAPASEAMQILSNFFDSLIKLRTEEESKEITEAKIKTTLEELKVEYPKIESIIQLKHHNGENIKLIVLGKQDDELLKEIIKKLIDKGLKISVLSVYSSAQAAYSLVCEYDKRNPINKNIAELLPELEELTIDPGSDIDAKALNKLTRLKELSLGNGIKLSEINLPELKGELVIFGDYSHELSIEDLAEFCKRHEQLEWFYDARANGHGIDMTIDESKCITEEKIKDAMRDGQFPLGLFKTAQSAAKIDINDLKFRLEA